MLSPLPATAWSVDHAAHLLGRAGFGGTPSQVHAFHSLGLDAAVGLLISARDDHPPAPEWTKNPDLLRKQIRMMMVTAGADLDQKRVTMRSAIQEEHVHLQELRRWWLERMRTGGQPLVEKMTLFWHGHFATSITKVKSAWAMWRQNQTLREHALGSFQAILEAMSRDPAMLRWLDLGRSRVGAPNENFARELMELFTLGVGNYSEADVKESARAFTGYRSIGEDQEFFLAPRQHDSGEKKFLGHTGPFTGDDILKIILAQPACARFVAGRIWEFFAYEQPEPAVLDSLAETFRSSGYQISPLLSQMFRSAAFYSKRAARTHIKSPVEWLVQTCVALECDLPESPALDRALEQLGQSLFQPPNVRGWEGRRTWISSSTLVLRYNLAGYLVGSSDPQARFLFGPRMVNPVDIARIAPPSLREQPDAFAGSLLARLFGTSPSPRLRGLATAAIQEAGRPVTDADTRSILQRLMSTPEYQLS